jgi:hypothetical protein
VRTKFLGIYQKSLISIVCGTGAALILFQNCAPAGTNSGPDNLTSQVSEPLSGPPAKGISWKPPTYLAHLPAGQIERIKATLDGHVSSPFPALDRPTGYLNYAIALHVLNMQPGVANQNIEKANLILHGGDSGDFGIFIRTYELFKTGSKFLPGKLSSSAQRHLEDQIWNFISARTGYDFAIARPIVFPKASENHFIEKRHFFFLAAQIFKNIPPAQLKANYGTTVFADGRTPAEIYNRWRDYISDYLDDLAKYGLFVEVGSHTYERYNIDSLLNIYNFAEDPIIRNKAEMILDLYFATGFQESIDYVRGGPRSRIYPSAADKGVGQIGLWNYGQLMYGPQPKIVEFILGFAVSGYRPPEVIGALAVPDAGLGRYRVVNRAPGVMTNELVDPLKSIIRYSYATPSYILGSAKFDLANVQAPASSQNRWQGVIFKGSGSERLYTQLGDSTDNSVGKSFDNFITLQHKNIFVTVRNALPAVNKDSGPTHIVCSPSPDVYEEGPQNWLFVKEGSSYAAVRIVRGTYTSSISRGRRLITLSKPFSPIIFVVNQESDYPDWDAFKAAVLAQPVQHTQGTTLFGQLTFHGPHKPGEIDGKAINYAPKLTFNSPFVRSKWRSGVIYMRAGDKTLILDFSDPKNPKKIIGGPIDSNYPPGLGNAPPVVFKVP